MVTRGWEQGLGLMANLISKLTAIISDDGVPPMQYSFLIKTFIQGCAKRKNTRPGNQGMASVVITSSDPRGEFMPPVLATLGSATQFCKGRTALPGDTDSPAEV